MTFRIKTLSVKPENEKEKDLLEKMDNKVLSYNCRGERTYLLSVKEYFDLLIRLNESE